MLRAAVHIASVTLTDPTPGHAPIFVGVEIGGTKLQIVAGNAAGRIQDRRRFDVDHTAGAEGIRAQIEAALPEMITRWQPCAVGVGFGGPVDAQRLFSNDKSESRKTMQTWLQKYVAAQHLALDSVPLESIERLTVNG